jgi:uncharacterized OB-fold protein
MLEIVDRPYPHPYPPQQSDFTRIFWSALAEGRFLTTRGKLSGRLTFPPKPISPDDWNEPIEWVELSGRGRLYSYTTMHAVPTAFQAEAPYRVCVVDLEEGVRLATRLLGRGPAVLDQPVQLVAVRYADAMSFAAQVVDSGS